MHKDCLYILVSSQIIQWTIRIRSFWNLYAINHFIHLRFGPVILNSILCLVFIQSIPGTFYQLCLEICAGLLFGNSARLPLLCSPLWHRGWDPGNYISQNHWVKFPPMRDNRRFGRKKASRIVFAEVRFCRNLLWVTHFNSEATIISK